MTSAPDSDRQHLNRYATAIHSAKAESPDAFQSWFNESESVEQSIVRGFWDFSVHILTPAVCSLIFGPEHKTALEIGYGGGAFPPVVKGVDAD